MERNRQSGFVAAIPVLLTVVFLLLGAAVTIIYSSRDTSQTVKGVVTAPNCPSTSRDCQESLTTSDGTSYDLTGLDASPYVGRNVVVDGSVHTSPSPPHIKVKSITPDSSAASPVTTPQPPSQPSPAPSSFSADQFYSQVQENMSYSQVVDLAGGRTGSCDYSNAPAPVDHMICSWQDSSAEVVIDFKNQKVSGKTKRAL